jgi:hypothetical protein
MGFAIKTAEQGCAWTTVELMLVSPKFAHTVCLWLLDAEPIHSIVRRLEIRYVRNGIIRRGSSRRASAMVVRAAGWRHIYRVE